MPGTEQRILAILTLRDEGAFLIDWLAHHRQAGFTDFLVFSNDCSDGTDRMLDRLQSMGWLVHVPNPGPHARGPQWTALATAYAHPLCRKADWIMTIDIDEFVNIHVGDHTIGALLSALPHATAIPLTWRLFGNAGLVMHQDRPIPQTFTRAAPAVMCWPWRAAMFKTLFRNDSSYQALGVHRPRKPNPARMGDQRWFDGSGRELPSEFHRKRLFSPLGRDNYALAQLNHYPLGAMDSFVIKVARGRANRSDKMFDLSYWIERNLSVEDDFSLATRWKASSAIGNSLRQDPVLGPLHDAALLWRRQRFHTLMKDENYRALFARLLMAGGSRPLTISETRFLTSFSTEEDVPRFGD